MPSGIYFPVVTGLLNIIFLRGTREPKILQLNIMGTETRHESPSDSYQNVTQDNPFFSSFNPAWFQDECIWY